MRQLFILMAFLAISHAAMATELPSNDTPTPWLRLDTGATYLKRNRDLSLVAYVPVGANGIRIVDTKTGGIYSATKTASDGSFFWSPDSTRLFFRELTREGTKITTRVRAWDHALKKVIDIDTFDGSSGMLSFDPRDNRMLLMHNKGIKMRRLVFPDERLAFWQAAQRGDSGKWVAAAGGMTVITQQGLAMTKLDDDGSGVESFDISPDGSRAAWATKSGRIFTCKHGEAAKFLDFGRDPAWHPEKLILAYAGGRMIGNKAANFNLKISDTKNPGTFITLPGSRSERWPQWLKNGEGLIYTIDDTADIFSIKIPSQDKSP